MQSLVIIPTYNEHETIVPLVQAVLKVAPASDILIVDDASPDGTGQLADALSARERRVNVIHRPRKDGLAGAYRVGFRYALECGYDVVAQMDADFSHRPVDLPQLFDGAASADVVVGSRNVPGGKTRDWPLLRRLVSRGGSRYTQALLRLPVRDCTSGFRCIRRRALAAIDLDAISATGFAFQVETNYLFHRAGMRLAEAPIVFPNRAAGQSKMTPSIFREAVWLVIRLRWNSEVRRLRACGGGALNSVRHALHSHGRRFMRFAAVGGCGVAVNSALLLTLVEYGDLRPVVAAALATEGAILSNFTLHSLWTFRDTRSMTSLLARGLRYNLCSLGGMAVTLVVLGALTTGLNVPYLVANLIAICAATLCNYAANARWTWPVPPLRQSWARAEADGG